MIYLYHTRRTGGRSVIFSVLGSLGDPQKLYSDCCRGIVRVGDKEIRGWDNNPPHETFFAWSHIPAWEVTIPDAALTVTLIRDPLERLLSHYRMLLLEDAHGRRWGSPQSEFEWLGSGPEDFIRRIPREHKLRQLYMFSKNFNPREAAKRIGEVHLWFELNRMEWGIKELSEAMGVELRINHVRETDWRTETRINIKLKPDIAMLWEKELTLEYEMINRLQGRKH